MCSLFRLLFLLPGDFAPADIVTAEAFGPVDLVNGGIGFLLRFNHRGGKRRHAQNAPAVADQVACRVDRRSRMKNHGIGHGICLIDAANDGVVLIRPRITVRCHDNANGSRIGKIKCRSGQLALRGVVQNLKQIGF